jgi:hypothetical protein
MRVCETHRNDLNDSVRRRRLMSHDIALLKETIQRTFPSDRRDVLYIYDFFGRVLFPDWDTNEMVRPFDATERRFWGGVCGYHEMIFFQSMYGAPKVGVCQLYLRRIDETTRGSRFIRHDLSMNQVNTSPRRHPCGKQHFREIPTPYCVSTLRH